MAAELPVSVFYCEPVYVIALLPVACILIIQTELSNMLDLLSLKQIYLWVSIT